MIEMGFEPTLNCFAYYKLCISMLHARSLVLNNLLRGILDYLSGDWNEIRTMQHRKISNRMVCISCEFAKWLKKRSDHCFDHKWSISGNSGHFLGGILYISRISSLRRFEWYPFEPLAEKKCICLSVPLFLVDLRSLTFNTKLNNR